MSASPAYALRRHERNDLLYSLSPIHYIHSLGYSLYEWQRAYYESSHKTKILNGARRAGKSFIISSKPAWRARFYPGSVTLVLAYSLDQAQEDMRLIKGFIARDPHYPELKRDNGEEIELYNKSRIVAVTASEKSARGYPDADIIIVDEAAFVEELIFSDCLYPMLNGNDELEFNFISTPHGKAGNPGKFFHDAFHNPANDRYEVRAPWEIDPENPENLIPAIPEKAYREERAKYGVKAFYSTRHANLTTQLKVLERGQQAYRQNNLVEFVEADDQVFSYDEIERAFTRGQERQAKQSKAGTRRTSPKALDFAPLDI
jgi:hypothetical protein